MHTSSPRGIRSAIVTPFNGNGNFFAGVFERPAAGLFGASVGVLYANRQTGEGWLQPIEQHKRVAEAGKWHVGGGD